MFWASPSTVTTGRMENRVALKASVAGGATISGIGNNGTAAKNISPAFNWSKDILLGAFYHSAAAATATDVWCTTFFN